MSRCGRTRTSKFPLQTVELFASCDRTCEMDELSDRQAIWRMALTHSIVHALQGVVTVEYSRTVTLYLARQYDTKERFAQCNHRAGNIPGAISADWSHR